MTSQFDSLSRPADSLGGDPVPRGERSVRAAIVAAARSWIGTPYQHQGRRKGVGCDCLGLLVGVWRELGGAVGHIPPYTPDWAEAAGRETLAEGLASHLAAIDPKDAREGDVALFRWRAHLPAKHGAILTAPDRMVHAQEGARVTEVALSPWWRRRMVHAFILCPTELRIDFTR
jgi:NlpC/P60 family putative phage cell wall peptidase